MLSLTTATAATSGTALLAGGILTLRASWVRRGARMPALLWAGWSFVALGLAGFSAAWGAEVGITYGLLALSVIAYLIIASTVELRPSANRAPRDAALEPEERPTNWPRAIGKSLLAIVLAGIASIGVGVAFAVAMPMAVHDRIVVGGLLVPLLWGGGMAWTLCDANLVRAMIILLLVSLISYGIAFLPKVML